MTIRIITGKPGDGMKLYFKSGRRMPLSHVFKWSISQIGVLVFFFGPPLFLGYQLFQLIKSST